MFTQRFIRPNFLCVPFVHFFKQTYSSASNFVKIRLVSIIKAIKTSLRKCLFPTLLCRTSHSVGGHCKGVWDRE